MKKLFLSLAAATMAFAANATIYVVGAGDGLSWDLPGKAYNAEADGSYKLEINNLSKFKFSTNQSTAWDGDGSFNAGAKGYSGLFGNEVFSAAGQTVDLVDWGEDQTLPQAGSYTITINSALTSMNVKANFEPSTEAPTVYLRGAMNNWGTTNPFTYNTSTETYTWTGTINAGVEFKIADGSWGAINYSTNSALQTDGTENILTNNLQSNMTLSQSFTGTLVFKINSASQATLAFTKDGEVAPPTYPEHVYVIGSIVGNVWNTTASNEMTNEGDGLYTIQGLQIQNGEAASLGYFALTTVQNSDWDVVNANRFGPAVQDTEAVEGENSVDGMGDLAWSILPGTYNMEFDYNDRILTITKVSGDVPVDPTPNPKPEVLPETLYLIGNVNGYNWSTSQGVAATNEEGVYTYAGVTVNRGSESENGYFSFATVLGEGWDGEGNVNSGDRYGATAKDEAIQAGEESMVKLFGANVSASGCNSWMLTPGKYDMVVNLNEMTLLVTVSEGGDIPVDPTPGELPEKLYLIGNVNGHTWDAPITGVETIGDEGVYIWEEVTVADANSGKGYFNIATVVGGEWDDTVNTGNRYGAPANDTPLEIGQTSGVTLYAANVDASGCQSWSVDAGTYTVIVNLNKMEITLADASTDGVGSLVAEKGEATYFNLQGQKVVNPDKGIYIKVVNGKAVKVIK